MVEAGVPVVEVFVAVVDPVVVAVGADSVVVAAVSQEERGIRSDAERRTGVGERRRRTPGCHNGYKGYNGGITLVVMVVMIN